MYTIVKDLDVPRELTLFPIDEDVWQAFGFTQAAPAPEELRLAQVELSAGSYDGMWILSAFVKTGSGPEDIVNVGEIHIDNGTPRDRVLPIADIWIRTGGKASWVPDYPKPRAIADKEFAQFAVFGVTLVRPV